MHDLTAYGETAVLGTLVSKYGVTLSGNFEANLSKLSFDSEKVQTIEGTIQFSSLVLNGVLRVAMGNVDSTFEPKQDHTQIEIMNNEGHVDLSGVVQLYTDMRYEVDMTLHKNASSTEAVVNGMQFVGKAQPDGSVRLQQNGKLTI